MGKQKYKPTFPTSRIKQIMRTDEEVGRVAAGALVCVSKSVELFIQHVVSATVSSLQGDKKVTLMHLKNTVHSVPSLDFLKDLVSSEPRNAKSKRTEGSDHVKEEESPKKKLKMYQDFINVRSASDDLVDEVPIKDEDEAK